MDHGLENNASQGCVIRRELVSRVGPWNEGLHKSQDLDYKARLMADETCMPIHTDGGLVFYRIHKRSITGIHDPAKFDSYVEVIDQIEAATLSRIDYEDTRDRLAEFLWFHSFWLYGKGRFSRGFRELKRARIHSPSICRRHGLIPAVLDAMGLAIAIGPGYYLLSRCRKACGLTQSPSETIIEELPTVVSC